MTNSIRNDILKIDRPVPRYTSYPTAPHFQKIPEDTSPPNWLKNLPDQAGISLYLHVPFCPKMCWYCGCHTKITQRYAPVEEYVQLMVREIKILAKTVNKTHQVKHIHFGGGSPGIMMAKDFNLVMETLAENFNISSAAEIALEIDPRRITEEKVIAYAKNGVNRVSLGVQDFDEEVLTAVNRQQPFNLSYDGINLFKKHGIDRVNLDLLYGLPHQTIEKMNYTIEKALLLKPSRIALFGYAHVPWMKKHMRLIEEATLPDKALRFDLFEAGAKKLKESGYNAIGIDHFAKSDDPLYIAFKEGNLQRNFQGYTTDACDTLVGIGASSISYYKDGYTQNSIDIPSYKKKILAGESSVEKYCLINAEDRLRSDVINALMCQFTVDIGQICAQHNLPQDHLQKSLNDLIPYIEKGFVSVEGNVVTINPNARSIVRIICSVFDEYLGKNTPEKPKYSKAI